MPLRVRTCQTAGMRTTPRRALAALIAAASLAAGCSSSPNGQATQPTTLAVGGSSGGSSTLPNTPPTVTVPYTVPPTTVLPTTLPSTTVAPTSTTPDGTSVTITRGAFIATDKGTSCKPTTCKYVQITSSGWEPGQPLAVTCYSASGSSGPYPKYADSSGNLSSGTACFFGNAFDVYVAINGVNSNVITPWKDW